MASWDDGYVTDVNYIAGFHPDTLPVWIATCAALFGYTAPDVTRPFRYADLGCGDGVTALILAATMPHAEVWGFDFNPAHIEAGREIARRAGLTNIHFEEASFDRLARLAQGALPMFDYMAAHGVLTWISRENRRHLFSVIGQRLAPGGIAQLGYNVSTGWSGMRVISTLLRQIAAASPERSDIALAGAFGTLEKIRDTGAAIFRSYPELNERLVQIKGQHWRYVTHELLARHWQPEQFARVATAMSAIKCDYICDSMLHSNLTGLIMPEEAYEIVESISDVRLRQTVRDIAGAVDFRRDLYQRGGRRMSQAEQARRTDAITLVRRFRPVPETMTNEPLLRRVAVSETDYRTLFRLLDEGPTTIGALRRHEALSGWNGQMLFVAITVLLSTAYVAPMLPEPPANAAVAACARLNRVHAALFDEARERPYLALPALGSAWQAGRPAVLAVDELLSGGGHEEQGLTEAVLRRLREVKEIAERDAQSGVAREQVTAAVRDMVRHHLPVYRRLGGLGMAEPEADV
ncbi:MAG: methyltransferase domain-containing protein [Acetobacteraceae bacterium]|nr:methyltransferase domain-containing protein [Acetobacteraceae bacterium]